MLTTKSSKHFESPSALVIGLGSIGRRHFENLVTIGISQIEVFEPQKEKHHGFSQTISKTHHTFDAALNSKPSFAIIASPTHLHLEHALQLAEARIPFFVEKPLSSTSSGLRELVALTKANALTTLVGCNMRFHPGPQKVKELIDSQKLGKLHYARLHSGSYLPEWRPKQDYRQTYSSQAAQGGGCILDCIHEIDLARWFLGEVRDSMAMGGHVSDLEIDTEDVALISFRHTSSALSHIHLDYVSRTYERGCHIAGALGSLFWDFNKQSVRWYDTKTSAWTVYDQPNNWNLNDMYLEEMRHFLACVKDKTSTIFPVEEAAKVTELALKVKRELR